MQATEYLGQSVDKTAKDRHTDKETNRQTYRRRKETNRQTYRRRKEKENKP